ncbi:MAG: DUF4184 family protein [Verrucomicrobiia bacterium]
MPFPLAHPAAVLSLRRYCPRWLSLPALIIGSLSPDMGYAFGALRVQDFSHRLFDGLLFCLPAGLLALIVFHRLCPLVVRCLPDVYRRELLPLSQHPLGSPWILIVSLLIGAVTHLLLDSFTHKDGWMTEHLAVLQFPLYEHGHRTFRVCHILWYLCSFVGIIWVCLVYQEWLAKVGASAQVASGRARFGNAVLLAVAVMVMSGSHYLTRHWWANFVEGAFTLLILLVFVLRAGALSKAK